ncbi:fumarylacetoacetase [Sphingopyxis sp.]|jgi:fumarylacetoacetase|uniref:fumarylacetoacetase n=1 Tax=Sphingopyxis sp. TaxID=1908224 RepID=UPI002DEEA9D3|nr:fumarylacetoacetase [Sphingopyxis sp.]
MSTASGLPAIDATHDAARTSWVASANGHADFPVQNLPLGIFAPPGEAPRGGIAIGDCILDLSAPGLAGLLGGAARAAAAAGAGDTLNALLALGSGARRALRRDVSRLLSDPGCAAAVAPMLHEAARATMHLPARVGDYTDFYVGIHHATNVGRLFRPDQPLLPNYKHVPIGYHGRASSVAVSGTRVVRPSGQRRAPDRDAPLFGPTERLDYELELGVWIGPGNALGEPIAIGDAGEHIAGLTLLNDWSARDVQAWEYQPLGPFLAKNFVTTVSPWIVTAEALAPFRVAQPARPAGDPQPMPYLWDERDQQAGAIAARLEVSIASRRMREQGLAPHRLSRGMATHMYWTIAQMVAHHSVGGCNLNPGDLLGTGTISGPGRGAFGSLLEITAGGRDPLILPGGEERRFIEDGDEISIAGTLEAPGFVSIGFGPCRGIVEAR